MKNLKTIAQFSLMTLLLVCVFGVYQQLTILNSNMANGATPVNQSFENAQPQVKLAGWSMPAGGNVPTVELESNDSDLDGLMVVPVIVLPGSVNTR